MSVLRLALDTSDPVQCARIEAMFRAAYSVRRAVQRDARDRARAYWAAPHERARDPAAPGGWRYEAHLMVLTTPYVSPSAAARRAKLAIVAIDRTAGVDVNVSNITV